MHKDNSGTAVVKDSQRASKTLVSGKPFPLLQLDQNR